MGIVAGYSRNTVSGVLPGGEIFGWSLWASEAPADQAATQAQADAVSAALTSSLGPDVLDPAQLLNTGGSIRQVTTYSYLDATGKASHIAQSPCVHPGTSASHPLPNQCCVVVTLLTAFAGRSSKGRIYLPVGQLSLDANGELPTGNAGLIGQWAKRFINLLNTAVAPGHIDVYSGKLSSGSPVTAVRVDSRIDIQRRRANRQTIEEAVTVPLA